MPAIPLLTGGNWMTKRMRWITSSASCCVYRNDADRKGQAMAVHNARFLVQFMAKLSAELRGEPMALDAEVLQRFDPLA
jgi:hypothetical protein